MNKIWILFVLLGTNILSFSQEKDNQEIPSEQTDTIDIDDIDFDDIDVEDIEEDDLSRESSFPWQKFAVGGQIGSLQFGDQTSISLAPEIVYNLNNHLQFGVDGVYELFKVNTIYDFRTNTFRDADIKEESLGGRLFTRVAPIQSFPVFLQFDYERISQENIYGYDYLEGNTRVYPSIEQSLNNFNGGLGFYNGPYYIALMYNFMNNNNKDEFLERAARDLTEIRNDGTVYTPQDLVNGLRSDDYYPNAVTFRAGLNIPLGQGNKNKKRDKNKKKKEKEEKKTDPSREN